MQLVMTTNCMHPFDQALSLEPVSPGVFRGHSSPAYWNMVGPFGGSTAATLLKAVLSHPDCLGEPVSLTVNYAGALGEGAFEVRLEASRTNRSTQHWTAAIWQCEADGQRRINTTATVLTAVRRETWSQSDVPVPVVPMPPACERVELFESVEWIKRYETRPIVGAKPRVWDGSLSSSLMQLWMRDAQPRAIDHLALAAMSDVFYPRIWLRRALRVPAGTVSMTVYFHADAPTLAATGQGYVLGQAQAQEFHNGFFDQTAQLWNEAGQILTTSHQIVYYKE
jgi:acyl-CoA thioesterase